jgi:hypothetical protein
MRNTAEYNAFWNAKYRCTDPDFIGWKYYGGRGVEFRFTSFEQFFAELGLRPSKKHTVDRINTDGHYEPGNLHWATYSEQNVNRRRYRQSPATCRKQSDAASRRWTDPEQRCKASEVAFKREAKKREQRCPPHA